MNTQIVGILNVSPDSFSDGQEYSVSEISDVIQKMIEDGASIIDVGAESTAPGSKPIDLETELARLESFFVFLQNNSFPVHFSIDTTKFEVAKKAIEHGVHMINDVSGGRQDPGMFEVIANNPEIKYVLMYCKNSSGRADLEVAEEQSSIVDDVIIPYFEERIQAAKDAGIQEEQIILDPGMGAFVSTDENDSVEIIKNIEKLKSTFGLPVFVGTSRKGFLGKLTQDTGAHDRLGSSIASALICAQNGADYIRIHDVSETRQGLEVFERLSS